MKRIAVAHLRSISPYSPSRNYERDVPKNPGETADEYEARTWRNRCHVSDGKVIIPGTCYKNSLVDAAQYNPRKIKGAGAQTYTKHFEAGVMVPGSLALPISPEEADGVWLHVSAKGIRGSKGGGRVWRRFPMFQHWEGVVQYYLFDDLISKDVFAETLEESGMFIGIGRYRPRNNGINGRFEVTKIDWS